MSITLIGPRKTMHPIDWTDVPHVYRFKLQKNGRWTEDPAVSAVVRTLTEAEDLVKFFGDENFCPFLPVLVMVPGVPPTAIIGNGDAPVAELRDLAVAVFERTILRVMKNGGTLFNSDAIRAARGLPRRDQVEGMLQEALWERVKRHKQNRRSDPPREPAGRIPMAPVFDMGAIPQ